MLVSIVINNHNYVRYVGEAIDSALAQRRAYPCVQVVVVDDGSTDASREVIASYGERIVVVLQPNGGQASAFNAGFAAATGDVIVFLDADDRLHEGAIARIAAAWHPDLAKLHFRLRVIDADGRPTGGHMPPAARPLDQGDVRGEILVHGQYVTPPTSGNAFARASLAAILPMPPEPWRIAADAFLLLQAPFHGHVAALDEPLGDYRVHGQNAWYQTGPDLAKITRQLDVDRQKEALIHAVAARHGMVAEAGLARRNHFHVLNAMAYELLAPRRGRRARLVRLGRDALVAIVRERGRRPLKRLALAAWTLLVMVLPARPACTLVVWQLYPATRPRRYRMADSQTTGDTRPGLA